MRPVPDKPVRLSEHEPVHPTVSGPPSMHPRRGDPGTFDEMADAVKKADDDGMTPNRYPADPFTPCLNPECDRQGVLPVAVFGKIVGLSCGICTLTLTSIRVPAEPPADRPDSGYSETRERADHELISYDDGDHTNRRPWPRWQWCVVILDVDQPAYISAKTRSQRAAVRCAENGGGRRASTATLLLPGERAIEVWGRDRWERLDPEQPASTIPVRPT